MVDYLKKAIQLLRNVENEQALTLLKKALNQDPTDPEVHRTLSMVYINIGELIDAIFHLEEALKIDPVHHPTWWQLGNVYEMEKNFSAAIEAYHKAAEIATKENSPKASRYLEWARKLETREL